MSGDTLCDELMELPPGTKIKLRARIPDPSSDARLIATAPDMLAALQSASIDLDVVASNLSDEPNGLSVEDCANVCAELAMCFRELACKATKE